MPADFQKKYKKIESVNNFLKDEIDMLSERAEETLLISLIADTIRSVDDKERLFGNILERISILKNIQYCACCELKKNKATQKYVYAAFSEIDYNGSKIILKPKILKDLHDGYSYITNGVNQQKDFEIDFKGFEFIPFSALLYPFTTKSIQHGIFVFIDDERNENKLQSMSMLLQNIIDIVVEKLDKIALLEELNHLNAELDRRVKIRTKSLVEANKKLNKEIKERKQVVTKLTESENRYRIISELTSDFSFAYRVEPDGKIVNEWVTGALFNLTGYSKKELESLGGWGHLICPEDIPILLDQMKALFSNQNKTIEYRIVTKDKKIHWMRDHSRPLWDPVENRVIRIEGAVKDITESKQSKEVLKKSEKRYRTLFEKAVDAIFVIDRKSGKYLDANDAALQLTGRSWKELCQLTTQDVCTKDAVDKIKEILESQDILELGEIAYLRPNGEKRTTILSSFPSDGDTIIEIARDITHELAVQKQLRLAQKIEAIGTLAGGIAHDFNNILFPVLGYTEMLLEDVPKDSPFRDNLNKIYTSSLRAKDLAKQILTFSSQEKSEKQYLEIQIVIKEALKLIRSTIPSTIEIQQELDADCGVIKADPTQIHQIVMNLATNAYHAMEKAGGVLKVILKEIHLGEYDVISADMTPGVYVCLTIVDTGTRMDKELIQKIFDPFFTTKGIGKGTGMGLSVVHGIVNNMGGTIHVYSEPGQGTKFNIYFPVEQNVLQEKTNQDDQATPRGIEKILLVDDEEDIIIMEKLILERLGYQVTACAVSNEALEVFRAKPDKFDLIITDLAMPNITGDKLAFELIKIRPDIPILLCTGFSETMSEEKAASLGIKGFLLKPIVMLDLAKKVREILDK